MADLARFAPSTAIDPPRRWQGIDVRELWRSRDLIYFLIWRDVKVRYRQTVLGVAWAVLQPASMMVVFTLVFGRVAGVPSGNQPYPLFVYAGLLPWTFFATAVTSAGGSVIGSERLITKVYFPRLCIPFAAVGAATLDFVIALGLLVAMMIYYGVAPGAKICLLPLVFVPLLLTALGIGTLLAALNVFFRDFRYVIPLLFQLWLFATPTIYMSMTGPGVRRDTPAALLMLNPLNSLIDAFRAAALGGPMPWDCWPSRHFVPRLSS